MMCYVSELHTKSCWLLVLMIWRPSRVCCCSTAWDGKDWMGLGQREVFGGNHVYYIIRSKLVASSWEIKDSLWHSCSTSSLRGKKMKSFAHLWAEGYYTNICLKCLMFFSWKCFFL